MYTRFEGILGMKLLLITGANGMLGQCLVDHFALSENLMKLFQSIL